MQFNKPLFLIYSPDDSQKFLNGILIIVNKVRIFISVYYTLDFLRIAH